MFQGRHKKPFKVMVWLVIPLVFSFCLLASASMVYSDVPASTKVAELSISNAESRKAISNALSEQLSRNIFPEELTFDKNVTETTQHYKLNILCRLICRITPKIC